jgi:hypothetical protein
MDVRGYLLLSSSIRTQCRHFPRLLPIELGYGLDDWDYNCHSSSGSLGGYKNDYVQNMDVRGHLLLPSSIRIQSRHFPRLLPIGLGYVLDDWGSRIRFPAGAGNFSLHHRVQNGSGTHPVSYTVGTRGSFPGGKAAGALGWPLTPSSAEAKNAWSYTYTPPIRLHA